jgi:hypothetical protein
VRDKVVSRELYDTEVMILFNPKSGSQEAKRYGYLRFY